MPDLIRSFVAVPAGQRLSAALTLRLDGWRERLPLRWTAPHAWHLTLQFLGDWPRSRLRLLQAALAEAGDRDPFTLTPAGLGAFPDLRRPRVLFLQLADAGQAAALAAQVRRSVHRVWPDGPQDAKPFRAHLTLARVRTPLTAAQVAHLDGLALDGLPDWPVTGFGLMASTLSRQGARHTVQAAYELRKKGE